MSFITGTAVNFVRANPALADQPEYELIILKFRHDLRRAIRFNTASANIRGRALWDSELARIDAAKKNAIRLAIGDLVRLGMNLTEAKRECDRIADVVTEMVGSQPTNSDAAVAS